MRRATHASANCECWIIATFFTIVHKVRRQRILQILNLFEYTILFSQCNANSPINNTFSNCLFTISLFSNSHCIISHFRTRHFIKQSFNSKMVWFSTFLKKLLATHIETHQNQLAAESSLFKTYIYVWNCNNNLGRSYA